MPGSNENTGYCCPIVSVTKSVSVTVNFDPVQETEQKVDALSDNGIHFHGVL